MHYKKSLIIAAIIFAAALSALGTLQSDSEVVKIVEKDRTTNLMTGSVFEIHFASGGLERFEYVTHRQNYCEINPNSSGCPPEAFPEKPPIMQKFKFEKTGETPDIYRPQESICLQRNQYQKCRTLANLQSVIT